MYQAPPPVLDANGLPSAVDDTEQFADFCDEVVDELRKFGKITEFNVCFNLGEHLNGNVYIKYSKEEEAEQAFAGLNGRFYAGKLLNLEFSPVTDFKESRCRQFDESFCDRGDYCNFMHCKMLPRHIEKYIRKNRKRYEHRSRSRDRERRSRRRSRSRSRSSGGRKSRNDYDEFELRHNSPLRRRVIAQWNAEKAELLKGQQNTALNTSKG